MILGLALSSVPCTTAAGQVPDPAQGFDTAREHALARSPLGQSYVADELLVGYATDADRAAVEARVRAEGAEVLGAVLPVRMLRLRLPAGVDPLVASADFARLPGVRYAEPNGIGQGGCLDVVEPDDTHFGVQWHLRNTGQQGGKPGADIEALGAWSLGTGDPAVVLAVLDSGIDFGHPEFVGRLLPGYDFVNEDPNATADHPHGILVTGIAAANTDNAFGVAGVDRRCTILPVKVLDQFNGGTHANLVQGLVYSAQQGAHVINMSLVNYSGQQALIEALEFARDAGCILVACAGNGGIGNANVSWPGASPLTISVGATTRFDTRAFFSGTGSRLDLVAPGLDVPTTSQTHGDPFAFFSGCSAATPVAAGTVSLLVALRPGLTHDEARQLLVTGAEDQVGPPGEDPPGRDDNFGWGRLNARRSLAATSVASYCTAKVNALGCAPAISAWGAPSASDASGFEVRATRVRNQKSGLLLYGFSGSAALPFQGGTLCVATPLFRGPVVSSGGAPTPAQDCSGVLRVDLNAYAAGALGGDPHPGLSQLGASIRGQWWSRDPGFVPPDNSSLSDALAWVVGP
jgi:subtilisin family serine protease